MLQVVYISSAHRNITDDDIISILASSRRNNRRDGVTGLLYSDGSRFLQVLEGAPATVRQTIERIRLDPRHRALVTLSQRDIDSREFGQWDMAHRTPGSDGAAFIATVARLVGDASPNVQATFEELAKLRNAA